MSLVQVVSGLVLGGLCFFFSEIWSKFSSGQAASIIGFSLSKKRLIGGFLFVLISLLALSLTALSSQTLSYHL